MIKIVIVGPTKCGKTEALTRAFSVYPREGYAHINGYGCLTHTIKVDETQVNIVDIPGGCSPVDLQEICRNADGALIFTDNFVTAADHTYKSVVTAAAPNVRIRLVNRHRVFDTSTHFLHNHIADLVKSIRAGAISTLGIQPDIIKTIEPESPKEAPVLIPETKDVWLLFTESKGSRSPRDGALGSLTDDADSIDEECQAYSTRGGAEEEIEQRFTFPVKYGATKYLGFKTDSGEHHLYPTLDACVAAIIQHGLARIEKATLH